MQETEHNIVDEAADWVSRIHSGDVDQANSDELRKWLAKSDEHRQVFQRMVDVHVRSDVIAGPAHARGEGSRRAPLNITPILAAAAAVALAVGFGLWMLAAGAVHFETATGERRLVRLEDGSSIHLNARSSVSVEFTDAMRIASMHDGEVVFDVNSDDERPFVVRSGTLSVRVTGTSFQVSHYADQTIVAVIEGNVAVHADTENRQSWADPGASTDMIAGEQLSYRRSADGESVISKPVRIDATRIAAWRDGWLYLDDRPLQELADRLHRQYGDEVVISDSKLAQSRFSVALQLRRKSETLSELQMVLPVRVEELPGERIMLHARR